MLEIRKERLSYEAEYFLDAAREEGEISAAAHIACMLYGEQATIDRMVRAAEGEPFAMVRRRERALAIEVYGAEITKQLPVSRRDAILAFGLVSMVKEVGSTVVYLMNFNFGDETVGGCALSFRRDMHRIDRDGRPRPRTKRRLYSPRAIRRYVKADDNVRHRAAIARVLLSVAPRARELDPGEFDAIQRDLRAQTEAFRRESDERWRAMMGEGRSAPVPIHRRRRRQMQKVVKRSAATAAAFLGAAAVASFARAEPVEIVGNEVEFSVARSGSLSSAGHGALDIVVSAKGERLGKLCLYQDETPALDQLASIAMHVQAGLELDVLKTGNLFSMTPGADAHPIVDAAQAEKRTQRDAVRVAVDQDPPRGSWDIQRQREEEYGLDVRHLYDDAAFTAVFGRAGPAMMAIRDRANRI